MLKILLLGATGAIGKEVASLLAEQDHEIHVTTRQAVPHYGTVRYIRGDAQDDSFLHLLLRQNWDVIIDFMIYGTAKFGRRLDALLQASSQYIFTSSCRVFAESVAPITERSPRILDVVGDANYLATDEYALAKARQEDLLRASSRASWTIIRPYITFGEGRLQLGPLEKESWLYRALHGRSIVFCDVLMSKSTTITDASDVARMIAALASNPTALGEDFNLSSPRPTTWGDVLSAYLDELELHLERRPTVILQDLQTFCRTVRSVPQVMFDRLYHRCFDPTKIGELFDRNSVIDCRDALQSRLRAQLLNGAFLPLDWRTEALRDRATGEHACLGEIAGIKPKLQYLGYRHIPAMAIKMVGRW
ncbi:MAG: NAD-dependent epimerase/dehydratase family protein [Polynucleobacter sp.]|nr:NAD-dependent epimerase/dehydratase family protein [Polynucleobacter sp.]